MEPLHVGFTGDVMLGRLVDEHQRRRPVEAVWGSALDRLQGLDGLCINLECCLSTRGEPWTATPHPFHFRADPEWAVPALGRAGVDYCSLANNHLKDFGDEALVDTLDALDGAGIARAGAGRELRAARAPALFEVGDLRVAAVSATDNTPEFAAGPSSPGVAHVEIDREDPGVRRTVRGMLDRARAADPDLLVASLHWGPNMTSVPPEGHVPFARWLVEQGVDVLCGHSAHAFHGVEVHDGSLVCYDAGDFVDDYAVDETLRNDRSFLFEVSVTPDGEVTALRLRPVEIREFAVHLADGDAAAWCRERMRERSARFDTAFERDGESLVVRVA